MLEDGELHHCHDSLLLPQAVTFDAVANAATLEFANDVPAGTYRLSIGESDESNNTIGTASNVGTLFDGAVFTTLTYLGDDVSTGSESVDDVDLYQVRLLQGQEIKVTVDPAAGLDAIVRVFDEAGVQVGVVDSGGAIVTESLQNIVCYTFFTAYANDASKDTQASIKRPRYRHTERIIKILPLTAQTLEDQTLVALPASGRTMLSSRIS